MVRYLFLVGLILKSSSVLPLKDTALAKNTQFDSTGRSSLRPPVSHIPNQFNAEVSSAPTSSL